MANGKKIDFYLANGTSDGLITINLKGWSGCAFKVPRIKLNTCSDSDINIKGSKGVGVYFLFSDEFEGKNSVYIGKSKQILTRLKQHLSDEFDWKIAVFFTSQDFDDTDISYIEDRLCKITKGCDRCKLETEKSSETLHIKDPDKDSADAFIENIKIVMDVLGYNLLKDTEKYSNQELLCCKGNGANAKGFVTSKGLVVLKDSKISDNVAPKFKEYSSYSTLRESLKNDSVIVNGKFVKDFEFSSPSAASAVILGCNSNGQTKWKTSSGTKLCELQSKNPMKDNSLKNSNYLFCKSLKSGADAKGIKNNNNGIKVLKGSKISKNIADSFKEKSYNKLRQDLINKKIIVNNIFTKDYEFNSLSAASSVVLGASSNGLKVWKSES